MADSSNQLMAAIGSYEMALPFQAVGIRSVVLTPETRSTFEATLEKLAREDYAVVFIQEDLFACPLHAFLNEKENSLDITVSPGESYIVKFER